MSEESKNDVVQEARELLETHSIVAMRVDKPYKEIRPLISALCDEGERLRSLNQTQAESIETFQFQFRVMKEAIEAALLHLQDCGYKTNKEVQEQLIAAISPKGSEQ